MWDKASLHELIETKMTDYPMIVVANREPFMHFYEDGGETIECQRPASGMAAALDPVMRAAGGVWVGHGSGDADRATVDESDHVRVPPEDPSYTLPARVVDQGRGGGLLPRPGQRRALAALPCHLHAPGVSAQALGDSTATSTHCSAMRCSKRPVIGRHSCSSRTTTLRCCRGISRSAIPT